MEEWYSRGYLPHRDKPGLVQHITFRLADSLPYNVLERLKFELDIIRNELGSSLDASELDKKMKTEKINRIEGYLDAGHGSSILKNADFAIVVKNVLKHFDESRYILLCWCIMPNHVHVLIKTLSYPLDKIVKSWKSYSAREINKISGVSGGLWHREYFDRYVRDEKHLKEVSEYIEMNPVKAGLVKNKEDWQFSSAYKTN